MAFISVTADPGRIEDLDAAIAQLTAIKNRVLNIEAVERSTGMEHIGVIDTASSSPSSSTDPDRALDDLWPRINLNLRKLMKAAAAFGQPYSTKELADALGADVTTTRSWRANLGRSMNVVYKNVPTAPKFFEEHAQSGGGWLHSIHPAYRTAITGRDLMQPYQSGRVPNPDEE